MSQIKAVIVIRSGEVANLVALRTRRKQCRRGVNVGDAGNRRIHRAAHMLDLIACGTGRKQRFNREGREGERRNNRTEEEDFGGFHSFIFLCCCGFVPLLIYIL